MTRFTRSLATLALALVGSAAAAGPGAAAQVLDEEPPVFSSFVAAPSSLPYEGGEVLLSVHVADADGVVGVGYSVYLFGAGTLSGALAPASVDDQGVGTYEGSVDIPANASTEAVSHGVELDATDGAGGFALELVGYLEVEAPPQFDERPAVSDPVVTPTELPASGGEVTVAATATDDRSVSEVLFVVDGEAVAMDGVGPTRFQGSWTAPANTTATAVTHPITVVAYDDIGQSDEVDAGSLVVAAAPAPDRGRLGLTPRRMRFGAVEVGKTAVRTLVVTNVGGTAVTGAIRPVPRPFALVGQRGRPVPFDLSPQESSTLSITFAPRSVTRRSAVLRVRRDDRRQPGLSTSLSGRGLR